MADKQQQASGSAASKQQLGSLLAAAAATAAAGAAAAWYWRSSQRLPATAQRSGSAPAKVLGIETGAAAAPGTQHDSDVDGTLTPPLRADLAAKMATNSTSWVYFPFFAVAIEELDMAVHPHCLALTFHVQRLRAARPTVSGLQRSASCTACCRVTAAGMPRVPCRVTSVPYLRRRRCKQMMPMAAAGVRAPAPDQQCRCLQPVPCLG